MSNDTTPQVITLTTQNSLEFLAQFSEAANKNGTFNLQESDVVQRAIEVLLTERKDDQIDKNNAVNILSLGNKNKGFNQIWQHASPSLGNILASN